MRRTRHLLTRFLSRHQIKILSLLVVLLYFLFRAVSDGKVRILQSESLEVAPRFPTEEVVQDAAREPTQDAKLHAVEASDAPGRIRLLPLSPFDSVSKLPGEHCDTEACRTLLDRIEHAKQHIDFAIYGILKQPQIFEALVAAKQRGVQIRGVVDRKKNGDYEYTDTENLVDKLQTVRADALPQKNSSKKSTQPAVLYDDALMHNKFFVMDGRWVWTASANLSDTDLTGYNANLAVLFDSPELAAQFTQEVDQMYERGLFHRRKKLLALPEISIGQDRVRAFFPPKGNMAKKLLTQIHDAKESIDVAIFYFTHKDLARDLILAHRRGVKVRVILDATAARNLYSLHAQIRDAGIPLKVENWGGKMHAKSVVIDGRFVVVGSTNWTKAGFARNDENLLVLDSPSQAALAQQWFDALWASIPERWLVEDPDPESWDSGSACTDGIDNDFDYAIDRADAGCAPKPAAILP